MTKLVDRGWNRELCDALASDSSHVRIISPFIKVSAIKNLLAHKPSKLQVITRFNLADFAAGVSDLAALRQLTEAGAEVRGIKNLHAKLYIFGSTKAIVTSANLTHFGLHRNFELGIVSDDCGFVKDCRCYFERLWNKANAELQIKEWIEKIDRYGRCGGRPNDAKDLEDYGADVGLDEPPQTAISRSFDPSDQAFVKFLGRSTRQHRAELSATVLEVIESSDCHWVLRQSVRPRQVHEGAVMFIGYFTKDFDIHVFGRAIAKEHVPGTDDENPEDLAENDWRISYPHRTRVQSAEFVAGTLANGVSLNELMKSNGHNSFASTKRNFERRAGNRDPHRAYLQQARVQLAPEGHMWLEERLQEAFKTYGKVSQHELDEIGWPDSA